MRFTPAFDASLMSRLTKRLNSLPGGIVAGADPEFGHIPESCVGSVTVLDSRPRWPELDPALEHPL